MSPLLCEYDVPRVVRLALPGDISRPGDTAVKTVFQAFQPLDCYKSWQNLEVLISETRSLAYRLGGKEGVKYLRSHFFWYSRTIISNVNHNEVINLFCMNPNFRVIP